MCRRLDGIPLAIELGAARAGSMPVEAIAARLDQVFRLLTGGPRTALPRQQTLRAALDWSWELLDEREQILLMRLAAFAGGWTLEAAERVCAAGEIEDDRPGGSADLPVAPLGTACDPRGQSAIGEWEVLDLLGGLVNKSLAEPPGEGERYRLLETVRAYAWEKLTASGEASVVRDRHLGWCVALAEEAEPRLMGSEQVAWLARLEAEHDNLRAALGWSLADASTSARAAQGLQLAGALWRFWYFRGYFGEGRAWLERAVAWTAGAPAALHARACNGAGNLAYMQGDYAAAQARHEQALAAWRAAGDRKGVSVSLVNLAWIIHEVGNGRASSAQSAWPG